MQPGEVINPGQNTPTNPDPAPIPPIEQPKPAVDEPQEPQTATVQPLPGPSQEPTGDELAHWQAADFVGHDKTISWYALLALVILIIAAGLYLITKDLVTTVSVGFIAVVFGVVAGMKPRTIDYSIYDGGIAIANKQYDFAQFKAFSILEEGAGVVVSLTPLKRFAPYVIVNLAQGQEDQIVEIISQYLPYQQRDKSVIDTAMHRLRF